MSDFLKIKLSEKDLEFVANIVNIDFIFFKALEFVKRNLLTSDIDSVRNINECDYKYSKIIYKDDNYYYKIYLSEDNFYLKNVLYLYNNNIIQSFTPNILFIKNNDNKIIGYKHSNIKTDMSTIKNINYFKTFYRDFVTKMRDNSICYFDFSIQNLGYIKENNEIKVLLIDIDLFISANIIFPKYKPINVSNVNIKWHLKFGINKYQKEMKKYGLYDYYELYKFYKK